MLELYYEKICFKSTENQTFKLQSLLDEIQLKKTKQYQITMLQAALSENLDKLA